MLYEPLTATLELRVATERVCGHGGYTEHRNKANHCAGTDRDRLIASRDQVVIEKPVLLIPKRVHGIPRIVHGIGDIDVVLPEFAGEILINGPLFRQQQSG
jgi:hypothetical protein